MQRRWDCIRDGLVGLVFFITLSLFLYFELFVYFKSQGNVLVGLGYKSDFRPQTHLDLSASIKETQALMSLGYTSSNTTTLKEFNVCSEYLPNDVFKPKLFSVTAENIDSDHHYDPKGLPNGLDMKRLPALKYAVQYMRAIDLPRIEKGKTCVVVGSSGILNEFNIGKVIDRYDYVFRFYDAPVQGYENQVGSRTSFRVTYDRAARNALHSGPYESDHFILVLTIAIEMTAPAYFVNRDAYSKMKFSDTKLSGKDKSDENYHIMNDFFLNNTFTFLSPYLRRNLVKFSLRSKARPTTGMLGLVVAARMCPEPPDFAGFSLGNRNVPYHYYGKAPAGGKNALPYSFKAGVHDADGEIGLMRRMIQCGMLGSDLTPPINKSDLVNEERNEKNEF